jgi:hypothetical protein
MTRVVMASLLESIASAVVVAAGALALSTAGCARPLPDPMQLDGGLLTVDNRTSDEWQRVEIWLNYYYRVTATSIPPHSRMQTPLDAFVAGFGQRFDYHRTQIRDLRLSATLPNGKPFEMKKQFEDRGLAGALAPFGGKR